MTDKAYKIGSVKDQKNLPEKRAPLDENDDPFKKYLVTKDLLPNKLPKELIAIRIDFITKSPLTSRDDKPYYLSNKIPFKNMPFNFQENAMKRDWVFRMPYIPASSWRGSLRSVFIRERLWGEWNSYNDAVQTIENMLFGSEHDNSTDPEKVNAGALHFYPTFFTGCETQYEIFNPQKRSTLTGRNPFKIETVPKGTEGSVTILFDTTKCAVSLLNDAGEYLGSAIKKLFTEYGIGAKSTIEYGQLEMRKIYINNTEKNLEDLPDFLTTNNEAQT